MSDRKAVSMSFLKYFTGLKSLKANYINRMIVQLILTNQDHGMPEEYI